MTMIMMTLVSDAWSVFGLYSIYVALYVSDAT